MSNTHLVVDRGATAIRRNGTSRPLALLIANELLAAGDRILDYGCGYGEDVHYLQEEGWEAVGWDPHHCPDAPLVPADVVLCSYVLNVIENPTERLRVLDEVHGLAERLALVAVRSSFEKAQMDGATQHGDGWLTSRNTFQTLWSQSEARQLIEKALDVSPVALAPGVFAVFKSPAAEEAWREAVGDRIRRARIRRGPGIHRPRVREQAYDEHREAYDILWRWVHEHGRLPEPDEVPEQAAPAIETAGSIGRAGLVLSHIFEREAVRRASKREISYDRNQEAYEALWEWTLAHGRLPEDDETPTEAKPAVADAGSTGRAGLVLRHLFGTSPFDVAVEERRTELVTRFALARLRRRSKFGDLPTVVQRDVRALFGSYKAACEQADEFLFALGDGVTLHQAARSATVGKLTSNALYVHISALADLPPALLVYDACARVIAGTVGNANIVKLHLDKPRVSYLVYPAFDTDPHPALAESWVVDLRNLDLRPHDYRQRENAPILHRKELFVTKSHARYATFCRLTAQEERHGLLEQASLVGTRTAWESRLRDMGWQLRGHRLVRSPVHR